MDRSPGENSGRRWTFIFDPKYYDPISGRVRAACLNCRQKKVKCDGDEPCFRCQRENVPCPGPGRRKLRERNKSELPQFERTDCGVQMFQSDGDPQRNAASNADDIYGRSTPAVSVFVEPEILQIIEQTDQRRPRNHGDSFFTSNHGDGPQLSLQVSPDHAMPLRYLDAEPEQIGSRGQAKASVTGAFQDCGSSTHSYTEDSTLPLLVAAETLEAQASMLRNHIRLLRERSNVPRQQGTTSSVASSWHLNGSSHPDSRGSGARETLVAVSPENATVNLTAVRGQVGTGIPKRVNSPSANLTAVYANFLDHYLPRDSKGKIVTAVLPILTLVPAVLPAAGDALVHATRALATVSLGAQRHDRVLLRQSTRFYGIALTKLRYAILHPGLDNEENVLATIVMMLMCSHHDEIRAAGDSWTHHIQGARQFLAATKMKQFRSALGLSAYSLVRHGVLNWSLLARQAYHIPRIPIPGAISAHQPYALWEEAMQVPALLERYDALAESSLCDQSSTNTLAGDCANLERKLRNWWANFEAQSAAANTRIFEELRIQSFPRFCNLCDSRTIAVGYKFANFSLAFHAVWYWISMHYVLTTQLALNNLRRTRGDIDSLESGDARSQELWNIILDLCKTIPFFSEPECAISGNIATLTPLRIAAVFFRTRGHFEHLRLRANTT